MFTPVTLVKVGTEHIHIISALPHFASPKLRVALIQRSLADVYRRCVSMRIINNRQQERWITCILLRLTSQNAHLSMVYGNYTLC